MTLRIWFIVLSTLCAVGLRAQNGFSIDWENPIFSEDRAMLWFEGASSQTQNPSIPSFCSQLFNDEYGFVKIINPVFSTLTKSEESVVANDAIGSELEIIQSAKVFDDYALINYCILPIRRNSETGELEKLVSFELVIENKAPSEVLNKTAGSQDTSVLALGDWFRVGVNSTGIYKITPQFLEDCGFNVSNLPSNNLRIFGNGRGMLSEHNDNNPDPSLQEVAVYVQDGGDGVFNGNDYALFYAVGPSTWEYDEDSNWFEHNKNVYSDESYYFITINNGVGKRIAPVNYNPGGANYFVTTFDDFNFIEDDKYNLVASGRRWFGDLFDFKLSYDYTLQFANLDVSDTAFIATDAVARSIKAGTSMNFAINGSVVSTLSNFPAISLNSGAAHVTEKKDRVPFFPSSNSLQLKVTYNNSVNSSATAWLDYVAIQVRRKLEFSGSNVIFRDRRAFRNGGAAEYAIEGANNNIQIWDLTHHLNARLVSYTINGTKALFTAPSDSLRTFAAINGSSFPLPSKTGSVANQNLHGFAEVDMIIVSHPNFLTQAEDLANYHRNNDELTVLVTTPQEIYNEFSSGMQDITAIKLFFRNVYKKQGAKKLKYALLFGDASYDYKNRVPNMHNFVPIYQSVTSFSLYNSFCTDDYFGFLDDGEGRNMLLEDVDIAIGRMPVKSTSEAQNAVEKVVNYNTDPMNFGDWRNRVLLVADDVDDNWEEEFVEYVDRLGRELDTAVKELNIEKVYIDSYIQEVKAGSQRYPEARSDIYRKVQKGNLVTSYLGHGGEVGWAKERILQLADVNGWDNANNMPLFSTITCEFTRVDDPARVSAGEQLFLNSNGGAIALYSTLRPVFATPSTYNINRELFEYLFFDQNGEYLTLGEVIQATKNNSNSGDKLRFALIGDPAMKLAIPVNNVMTDSINGIAASVFNDTLKALSKVKISGHIENASGSLLSDFNGIVNPTVYDKKSDKTTLMNDGKGSPIDYKTRENVIFRGTASVQNGLFSFEFVVPLDISFVVDLGKISYYATDSVTDANGYNTDVLIGDLNLDADFDDEGPLVRVFINDTNFISGGLTDSDPVSLGLISDSSGINTVGNGIGHDIIGILDGNTASPYILNDYFKSDLNSYQSGSVDYPFFDLAAGTHTLLIRAWDVNNNPGEGEVTFVVDESHQLALQRVLNYPNPFSSITRFQFEHNRAGEPLEIEIHIFDQAGNRVTSIKESLVSTGNRVNQITWDGTSDAGSALGSGVYVYRVRVKSTEDGSESYGYSKLVFIK